MSALIMRSLSAGALVHLLTFVLLAEPTEAKFPLWGAISGDELQKKLADNKELSPGQLAKMLKHCKTRDQVELNGVNAQDLLDMNRIKMSDCDAEVVLERLGLCKKAEHAPGGLASVTGYCKNRVEKLVRYCADEIDELTEQSLLEVSAYDLDIIRMILRNHMDEPNSQFKAVIDAYLEPHGHHDKPAQKKHEDVHHSCERLMRALKHTKVILEHEREYGLAPPKSDLVANWTKAYMMCQFYFANYQQCETCKHKEDIFAS